MRGYAASSHDGRESPEALPGHSGQHGHPEEVYREMNQGSQKCKPGEGGNTPTLEQYSRDLTALAEEENWILWWEESRRLSGSWRS